MNQNLNRLACLLFSIGLAACGGGGSGATPSGTNLSSNGGSNGTNTIGGTPSAISYTVSGTVMGLTVGQYVTLNENGADPTTVSAPNTAFKFSAGITENSPYAVTIDTNSLFTTCSVSANGAASQLKANVNNVGINCAPYVESVLYSYGHITNDAELASGNVIQGSDNNLYGLAIAGGQHSDGVLYQTTPDGTQTILHSFGSNASDGTFPNGRLIEYESNFYGVTYGGGVNGLGTVFRYSPSASAGSNYQVIYSFVGGSNGSNPRVGLTLGDDGNLYGVTTAGGKGNGVFFRIVPTTGVETGLYSFGTNSSQDVSDIEAELVLAANSTFYGVSTGGGGHGQGAVFAVAEGGAESILWNFTGGVDGGAPNAALVPGPNGFYGTTTSGGNGSNFGTLFKLTLNGNGSASISPIYNFPEHETATGPFILGTDGNLYGVVGEALPGQGALYKITPDGQEYTLYSFGTNAGDLYGPVGIIRGSNGFLYGVCETGGANGMGGIFKYSAN